MDRAMTRRGFIGAAAVAAAGAHPLGRAALASTSKLPPPARSGIDHIVVVLMENRSFDHFLGWLPGADGRQAGMTFEDSNGVARNTYRLSEFHGCGHSEPDHSWEGGRAEYGNRRCNP